MARHLASQRSKVARGQLWRRTKKRRIANALAQGELGAQEGMVDDPRVANPLERLERLGTRWFGIVFDWEGVVVKGDADWHAEAWRRLAEEEGRNPPLEGSVQRALGMKPEQALEEVLTWTRAPGEVSRLAERKRELTREVREERGETAEEPLPGIASFIESARKQVPCGVASEEPEDTAEEALGTTGLLDLFDAVVTASDVARRCPDPEQFLACASQLKRPPLRCVAVVSGNNGIEAAKEGGMKCVALSGYKAAYELSAADLVVSRFSDLSFRNLQQLFRAEDDEFAALQSQMEPEMLDELRGLH